MSSDSARHDADNALENTTYMEAIAIVGIIVAALIALIILRFCVNILIDVIILGDLDSARRSIGSIVRRLCPWWHRRTQPETGSTDEQREGDIEANAIPAFQRRSLEERKAIIASILSDKVSSFVDLRGIEQTIVIIVDDVSSITGMAHF